MDSVWDATLADTLPGCWGCGEINGLRRPAGNATNHKSYEQRLLLPVPITVSRLAEALVRDCSSIRNRWGGPWFLSSSLLHAFALFTYRNGKRRDGRRWVMGLELCVPQARPGVGFGYLRGEASGFA